MSRRRVFKDDLLQKDFEENGYCVVDLLNPAQIEQLTKTYFANQVEEQQGIELSIKDKDYNLSKRIVDLTAPTIANRLEKYLDNYRNHYAGFVTKKPGRPNQSHLHRDPTFVDESKFVALNVWIPLVDVDEKNGAFHIVKHSHQFFDSYRGYTIKEYDYEDICQEVMSRFGTLVKMKAGQALIYDVALLHYSFDNTTENIRIAATAIMIPAEAELITYHYNREMNCIDVYGIDNDFILGYSSKWVVPGQLNQPLLKRLPYKAPVNVTMEQFENLYYRHNPKPKKSFFDFLSFKRKPNHVH